MKILSNKDYEEYKFYKNQAEQEAEEWDNCHCTCGEVEYTVDDALVDLYDQTDVLFDITDDLQGEIRFNQKVQRLVNKTFREEIQDIKDGLETLLKRFNSPRANTGTNKKKTNLRTGAEVMDFMEKSQQ